MNDKKFSCGCSSYGLLSLVLLILLLWALFFGLQTSWGTIIINLFPPYVGIN